MTKAKGAPLELEALGKVLAALTDLDERQRDWVITSAISNLGVATNVTTAALPTANASAAAVAAASVPGQPGTGSHARAFLRNKRPKNSVQQIACLAYYLTHFRQTPKFKTKDITKLNSEAGGTRIGNPSQAMSNALYQSGYVVSGGSGTKVITALGEDIANALPSQEAVKAIEAEKPRTKRRRRAPTKKP